MPNRGVLISAVLAVLCCATETRASSGFQDIAEHEYNEVMKLKPNIENGKAVYRVCAVCHLPEAWGTPDGTYPQIAGQSYTVIIKQLTDIRARNRDNPLMYPFTIPRILGGPQELADVAAYIAQLPMSPHRGMRPNTDLEYGKKVYQENCVDCHGENGEGNPEKHIPSLWGQHYQYLMRQFEWIKNGKRRNSDPEMVKQIQRFTARDVEAVMGYAASLRPPEDKVAHPEWMNPDFPNYVRTPNSK